jgi:hypothetical protein
MIYHGCGFIKQDEGIGAITGSRRLGDKAAKAQVKGNKYYNK